MRRLLVGLGDLARLVGVVAMLIGLAMAGDLVAGRVRELPCNPMRRHLR